MVGEQREGQDIVGRIEKPAASHARNEWILEDLRSRNREILDKEQMRNRLFTFTLFALGATVGFLVQSDIMLHIEWMIFGGFGLAMFFGFLGTMSLYFGFFEVVASKYIRSELVPRARHCLGQSLIAPYDWEDYLHKQRKKSPVTMLAYHISEVALFVLPFVGSVAFAVYGLIKYYGRGLKPVLEWIIWSYVASFAVVLGWLVFAAILTTLKMKIAYGEMRFQKHKVRKKSNREPNA